MPTIDNWRALRDALEAGPTDGRWRWEINMENKRLHLVGGPYREFDLTIMDFDRWGMSHAVATLRDPSVDGMNIMHRLPDRKDWIAPFPDRAHHADWCQQVTHPDMRWIQEASPKVIRSLLDERDRLEKALALVQQHHATAWNRGHTIGMAAQEETARKALDAVKADAWGNAQLTDALLSAEAERDRLAAEVEALRADAGRYRWLRAGGQYVVNCEGGAKFFCGGHTVQKGSRGYEEAFEAGIDAAMKGKP